jgi:hypothetical protein
MFINYKTIDGNIYYEHKVEKGENLSAICQGYFIQNFMEVLNIYNHPVNREFRLEFPDPSKIMPGSVFYIPVQPIDRHKSNKFIIDCINCPSLNDDSNYRPETFELVRRISELIYFYSSKYSVPPVAVAGSIADEYNTRTGPKAIIDWLQDEVLLNFMPNFAIEIDGFFNFESKLLNATHHDIGIGNIKLETAKEIYEKQKDFFENKDWNYTNIIDYIRSNEGTVHFASLVIKQAKEKMQDYILDYSDSKFEAVLITYYKQGEDYFKRFSKRLLTDPSARIEPGEGCRVCKQRILFLSALGMLENATMA